MSKSEEEKPKIFSSRDLLGLLPVINIFLAIVSILLIPNFLIDIVLFFMLVLTIAFFLSMIIEVWEQKQNDSTENSLLIYNSMNVSPLVLYAGQFFYGYFFLSFIFLGFIEVVSILSIFVWVYFGFSTFFLVWVIRNGLIYVKEAEKKKEDLKKKIVKDFNEHKKTENYAAQSYYLQLLIEIRKTPLIKAGFLSKLITVITILLTIVPFFIT
jgi:small-conductance mechanosensitive channel